MAKNSSVEKIGVALEANAGRRVELAPALTAPWDVFEPRAALLRPCFEAAFAGALQSGSFSQTHQVTSLEPKDLLDRALAITMCMTHEAMRMSHYCT